MLTVTSCVQIHVAPPPPATQLRLDKRKEKHEANAAKEQLAAQRRANREEKLKAKEAATEAKRAALKRARQVNHIRTRNDMISTFCLTL
jgi:hypothetical protein